MSDSNTVKRYSGIGNIKEQWLNNIAPNYFDMDDVNNYQTGIFGYINEVMANTTEDAFNAVVSARSEFYPITAQFKRSLNRMAIIQQVDLPMSTPAVLKATLVIPEKEILEASTYSNGIYTFVLDNTMKAMAGDIPFMLDYPIIIISKKIGDEYTHTCHYDTTVTNSMSTSSNQYVSNKTLYQNGVKYLALFVTLRQVELQIASELVTKDVLLEAVNIDFPFTGDLAGFEVFYKENDTSDTIQLKKVIRDGRELTVPFCFYELISDNKIRVSFIQNPYFNPAFNSEISIKIYTSKGTGGNFKSYNGTISCIMESEDYPSNNTMSVFAVPNGESIGGRDKPTDDEFRDNILYAYSTNNTITTAHDLQLYFLKYSALTDLTKVVFKKRRDDVMHRLFGAYLLMKDEKHNVIPTNTLDLKMYLSQLTDVDSTVRRVFIKPGTLFEYANNSVRSTDYTLKKVEDLTLYDDLLAAESDGRYIFTNPFLISITLNPNIVGFYVNSIDEIKEIEYSYINDNTINQFITTNTMITRNAIAGENYYKITVALMPSSDIKAEEVITINDPTLEENMLRATQNGVVSSCAWESDRVYMTITYADNSTFKIPISTKITTAGDGTISYDAGYTANVAVGDTITVNDIMAVKNVTDLGKLRLGIDFQGSLYDNNLFIPMCIEGYIEETNTFIASAYISTKDEVTLESNLIIEHGIYNNLMEEDTNVPIPMKNLVMNIHCFYLNDDMNYTHQYSTWKYFEGYTLTNTFSLDSNDDDKKLTLIKQFDFIRSTLSYLPNDGSYIPPGETEPDINPGNYILELEEVPVVKADWAKDIDNFEYITSTFRSVYDNLYTIYFLLENNFGIDMKLYNTYGKSRYFTVGIKNTSYSLDNVNCEFNFGVYLTSVSGTDTFIEEFRAYVKEQIESINDLTSSGQSVYIMNLIANIKNNFPEIGYIEYYGFNTYDTNAQKIESSVDDKSSYIPEFLNVATKRSGAVTYPAINVDILTDS